MASKVDELDFSKLRAFELVARHGTLQVAAARLNLTVSAVSTQIKRLEEIVGTELFRRTPGKLAITAEGERLAADTRQLLDAAQRALIRLHEQTAHSGHVNLSLGADYAWLFMPKIDSFLACHPSITTAIRIHRGTEAMTALQKGEVDFCIGAFLRRPRGTRFHTVATSTMSMISRGRKLADASPFSAVHDRLIVAPRSATVRTRLAKSQKLKGSINYLECPTCHTAIDLVKRESGPAIVHSLCLSQAKRNGISVVDLGNGFGIEQIVVAYKASTLKQSLMSDLFEWLAR
ncbi:MAG TPA: LysR family transcriptional regulator [Xanthobacteraceae bacterium]|jgi:DNA-binding transcriptional LysR family regulator